MNVGAANLAVALALLAGAIEASLLRDRGIGSDRLITVPDAETGRLAVESGLAAALVLSAPTVRWMAAHSGSDRIEALTANTSPEGQFDDIYGYVAFAFRRSDHRLVQRWNRELHDVLADASMQSLLGSLSFSNREQTRRGQ